MSAKALGVHLVVDEGTNPLDFTDAAFCRSGVMTEVQKAWNTTPWSHCGATGSGGGGGGTGEGPTVMQ